MFERITGIHHITAIASDPQKNVDFYTGLLGLRLVKKTVNFDDPGTYHLYYGDRIGHPGTILTFFPWPGMHRGRRGTGETAVVSFAVPKGSLGVWAERAAAYGVTAATTQERFGEERFLAFSDPDGMQIELVEVEGGDGGSQTEILGFHSATLFEEGYERTARLLTGSFGFELIAQHGNRFRYQAAGIGPGQLVDLMCMPDLRRGSMGAGTVHHIAWRTATDELQSKWRAELAAQGYNVTPVMDRQYFHSIYFREPGGVLFEIATDPPGFAIDETVEQLGTSLKLPQWLEPARPEIERALPAIRVSAT
jgi:glyoxalase family protein